MPEAQFGPIKVPAGPPDDRFVFLSDVLPTAWQTVECAGGTEVQSLLVLGLGPIGDMAARVARHRGIAKVIAVDLVPERLERARARGVDVLDLSRTRDVGAAARNRTDGQGVDAVIDAVGMEAHGSPAMRIAQSMTGHLPNPLAERLMLRVGGDRLAALQTAIDAVRRGGTISLPGVYGGMNRPLPMMRLFDKQIQLRMGQANVHRWVEPILPLLFGADDPLGVDEFATHHLSLDEARGAYQMFEKKADGAVKIPFQPSA